MLSPRAMALRSRHGEEQLKLQSETFRLRKYINQSKPRKNTRLTEIMEEIHNRLTTSGLKYVPAYMMEDLRDSYSPPTLVKAKRMMGVKSVRRDGSWFWTQPKLTPLEAINLKHEASISELDVAQAKLERLERQVCKTLGEILKDSNYCISNAAAYQEMHNRGFGRSNILRAKADLKIATKKVEDVWNWVWFGPEVQDWLVALVGDQSIWQGEIYRRAMLEHHWCMNTVQMAMTALGCFRGEWLEGKLYYYNNSINSFPEPEKPAPVLERRLVIVDFSEPEPAEEEFEGPDMSDIDAEFPDVPEHERTIKTPQGVKIHVFED